MSIKKLVVLWQGLYYAVTGAWAIINIKGFSVFTHHQGDYFVKHANAVLFFIIGLYLFWHAVQNTITKSLLLFTLGCSIGIAIVEVYYMQQIGNPWPFWIDVIEELIIGFFCAYLLIFRKKKMDDVQPS